VERIGSMFARLAAAVAFILALAGGAVPAVAAPLPQGGTMLEDQLGNRIDAGPALLAGHTVIVVSNERDASASLGAWHRALADRLPTGTRVVLVADLRALPFFVPRASVATSLRKDHPQVPILLDWKGALAAAFDVGRAGVAVEHWQGGQRINRVTGKPNAASLAQLGF
jgi:hypothetical protein